MNLKGRIHLSNVTLLFTIKGRDRLEMLVELKVQYHREKLQGSFDTNETFLRCAIFI